MARERGGFWVGLAAVVFYPITWLVARRRFDGLERIPRHGPALIVANHISDLDPVYAAVFVHRARRVPRFLAKDSLWKAPVLGSILRGSEQIPVYRGSMDAQASLKAATAALEAGKIVVIYPEGTVTRDPDSWPMWARTGVARIALAGDVPVLPVAIWGTQEVYNYYRKKLRLRPRQEIVMRCGEPLDLSPFRGQAVNAALLRQVTDHVMVALRELLAELRHEPAPAEFFRPGESSRGAGEVTS